MPSDQTTRDRNLIAIEEYRTCADEQPPQAQPRGDQRVFASLPGLKMTAARCVCILGCRPFTVKLRACSLRVLTKSILGQRGDGGWASSEILSIGRNPPAGTSRRHSSRPAQQACLASPQRRRTGLPKQGGQQIFLATRAGWDCRLAEHAGGAVLIPIFRCFPAGRLGLIGGIPGLNHERSPRRKQPSLWMIRLHGICCG